MATITDTGLNRIAATLGGNTADGEDGMGFTRIGLGQGNTDEATTDTALDSLITRSDLAIKAATTHEYLNTTEHSHTVHLSVQWTNAEATSIRELGVYGLQRDGLGGYDDKLIIRHVFSPLELQYNGIMPAGRVIQADVYVKMSDLSDATGFIVGFGPVTVSLVMAEPDFSPTAGLAFANLNVPGANIIPLTHARGGRTWEVYGYTDDYSFIDSLMAYAVPVSVGQSILGNQFVSSAFPSYTFRVQNKDFTYTAYPRCRIQNPIEVEQFGNWQWFYRFNIIQSYSDW